MYTQTYMHIHTSFTQAHARVYDIHAHIQKNRVRERNACQDPRKKRTKSDKHAVPFMWSQKIGIKHGSSSM